jgi:hypothetical protein
VGWAGWSFVVVFSLSLLGVLDLGHFAIHFVHCFLDAFWCGPFGLLKGFGCCCSSQECDLLFIASFYLEYGTFALKFGMVFLLESERHLFTQEGKEFGERLFNY